MSGLFVTATGTDIGKTFVGAALIRALRSEGREVDAFKPVLSGYRDFAGSDAARLLEALGKGEADLERMSPLRFAAELAPPSAARLEGHRIEIAELVALCRDRLVENSDRLLLVEGAGGVMSPIADDGTNLDLAEALGLPAILVTGSYLGSVSHTLTALLALGSRKIAVEALVVSESPPPAPSPDEIKESLRTFVPDIPLVFAPRDEGWTAEALAALVRGA